jgi:hypothetical protein
MFTDPQTVTYNSVGKPMPKIKQGVTDSTYRTADETFQLRVSHQSTKSRTRRMVRLDQTIIAADPLSAINTSQSAGVYLVIDEPKFGFDDATLDYMVDALVAWLTAGNIAKLLGSET